MKHSKRRITISTSRQKKNKSKCQNDLIDERLTMKLSMLDSIRQYKYSSNNMFLKTF